jgi:uncharacterized membrane protein YgcG
VLTLGDRVSHADPARAAAVARAQLLAVLGRDTQRRASRLRAARGGWAQALLSRLLARLSLQVFAPPPHLPSPPPLAATSAQSRRARQNARRHAAQVARVSVSVSSPGARPGCPFAFELALAALTLGVNAPEEGSFHTPRRVEVCAPSPARPAPRGEDSRPMLHARSSPPVRCSRPDASGRGLAGAGAVAPLGAGRAGRRARGWRRLRASRAAGCRRVIFAAARRGGRGGRGGRVDARHGAGAGGRRGGRGADGRTGAAARPRRAARRGPAAPREPARPAAPTPPLPPALDQRRESQGRLERSLRPTEPSLSGFQAAPTAPAPAPRSPAHRSRRAPQGGHAPAARPEVPYKGHALAWWHYAGEIALQDVRSRRAAMRPDAVLHRAAPPTPAAARRARGAAGAGGARNGTAGKQRPRPAA